MTRVLLLTIAIVIGGCGLNRESEKNKYGQNDARPYHFLTCEGKLYAGSDLRSGEDSPISLHVETPFPNKDGPHRVGLYTPATTGMSKFYTESYDVLYIGPTLIEFGQAPADTASDGAPTTPTKAEVFGRLVKGSGFLEISWHYKREANSKFEWRGKCKEIDRPVLTDIDGILSPKDE